MSKAATKIFWFTISLLSAISVTFFLSRPAGQVPALGPLLNPHSGIWRHQIPEWKSHTLKGLQQTVKVAIDAYGVPHIFAENDHDLYMAQGYIVARYRLFQMDLSTRVAAGRLSELVGSSGEEWDQFFLKFGLGEYSKSALKKIMAREDTKLAVESYLKGVNQWIERLDSQSLPPEYKILGKWPERLDESRVSNLLILMSFNLAGRTFDLSFTQFLKKHGAERTKQFYSEFMPDHLESYFTPPPVRGRDFQYSPWAAVLPHLQSFPKTFQPAAGNGSNNFAVGPQKSSTGFSILANDTHLSYSLPNVWLENHLITPSMNVYGVSFPMGPGVVLGFNARVAWGVTNGTTDVLDWFEVEFKDTQSLEYKFGSEWKLAEGLPGGVVRTDFGFIMQREGVWGLAARWAGERMGDELHALLQMDRTQNFADCVQALEFWFMPAQNWICADAKNIGIFHRGWIPQRQTGEGLFIEAARPEAWTKGIPFNELPHAINPSSGFVSSANQRPVNRDYKYYLAMDYEDPARGETIRRRLSALRQVSPEELIALQNDIHDIAAEVALPLLLKHLNVIGLTVEQKEAVSALGQWNFAAMATGFEPTLFKTWWTHLRQTIDGVVPRTRLQWLLEKLDKNPKDMDAFWLDDPKTPEVESLDDQVLASFVDAWQELTEKFGADYKSWQFRKLNKTVFPHVAKFPGFASQEIPTNGSALTVQANKGNHGAVYKMVVQLGDDLKAWSMVPGGADGDPFSSQYGRSLPEWSAGKMNSVFFWRTWAEAKQQAKSVFELHPGEGAR